LDKINIAFLEGGEKMRKVINRNKHVRYLIFLLLVLSMVMAVPVLASAQPTKQPTATLNMVIDAENVWRIEQTGSAPTQILTVGESTQATFDIVAKHAVDVTGSPFTVHFNQTVTDATYINSLDICLEVKIGGKYVSYTGRDGKPVKISVVSSPLKVTQPDVDFKDVKGTIDISTNDTVGKDLRWAVYMTSSIDGVVRTDEYEQQDVHWHKP
jgi:hypothetical protein